MAAKKKDESREITLGTLDLFVRAVVSEYPRDPCKPSVTLSLLNDGNYYASVLRYAEKFGEGKVVVCSARALSLEEVIRKLGEEWLSRKSAKSRLADNIGVEWERAYNELADDDRKWGR